MKQLFSSLSLPPLFFLTLHPSSRIGSRKCIPILSLTSALPRRASASICVNRSGGKGRLVFSSCLEKQEKKNNLTSFGVTLIPGTRIIIAITYETKWQLLPTAFQWKYERNWEQREVGIESYEGALAGVLSQQLGWVWLISEAAWDDLYERNKSF